MPKVSVIIPIYNTERYLRQCLDSVVNQTLRDIEIICVNDGSTDGSLKILKEYEAKDKRIKLLTQKKTNAGSARNNGLFIASGEYLSFLDSDDYFELTMLEHMYECAKKRRADIVVCELKVFNEDTGEVASVDWHIRKELLPSKMVFSFRDIKKNAFLCITASVWDKLIKRDLVMKNQLCFQSQQVYEDTVFAYSAMISAERITILKEFLVYYRKRSTNDSNIDIRYKHVECVHSTLSGLKEYLISNGLYERYKRDFISFAIYLMHYTCFLGENTDPVKEIQNKVELWLDEFEVKGQEPYYYYELPIYQVILQKTKTQSANTESARLQQELERLHKSLPFRVGRLHNRFLRMVWYANEKGLRFTIHRFEEKLTEYINCVKDKH